MRRAWYALMVALYVFVCGPAKASDTAIVSITFDDSLRSQLDILPVMQRLNMVGTLFIIAASDTPDVPGRTDVLTKWTRLAWSQIKDFTNAGWELGSHTVTHVDLTTVDLARQERELQEAQARIFFETGKFSTAFASPNGAFNEQTLGVIRRFYNSQFGIWWPGLEVTGFNDPATIDPYRVTRLGVTRDEPSADRVCQYVTEAVQRGLWYVLAFHNILPEVGPGPDDEDAVTVAKFTTIVTCVAHARDAGKLRVMTVSDALARIKAARPR